jgi:hypothetical protein
LRASTRGSSISTKRETDLAADGGGIERTDMSDHANNAAAVAAGWTRTQIDYGAAKSPRFMTTYEKVAAVGPTGAGPALPPLRASAMDDVQATADTKALAALNNQRGHRYGTGATVNSGHTFDVT